MKEIYCIVYGEVQGVMYRQFLKEKAEELAVTGYAKNLDDGTMEVVAQGSETHLRQFLEFVSTGPEHAEVESITVSWGPAPDILKGFKIQ